MNLQAKVVPIPEVTDAQIERMLALMNAHYENVSDYSFRTDLARKNWVIILEDGAGIQGFSTQSLSQMTIQGTPVRLLFSGDTIIDQQHWGSPALSIAWGRMMLSLLADDPSLPLYWILTSKGYKTYRFLPVFFKEYYPHSERTPPDFAHRLLTTYCKAQYGPRFDPVRWIIRAENSGQRLRPGLADITPSRRRNRDVLFFESSNPGHARGDELACIAQFHPKNLTPFIRRWLAE